MGGFLRQVRQAADFVVSCLQMPAAGGQPMPVIPRILELLPDLSRFRRDIHANPELAFEESRTSDLVAARLTELGCEVHRGIARTGVVGTLRCGNATRSIGLRADMDA